MFSYTGLNRTQVKLLKVKYHIYMLESGRISVPGRTFLALSLLTTSQFRQCEIRGRVH